VQTTLDLDAQQRAVVSVEKNLDPDQGAEQAAVVTLDGTGAVLAMIGGASYTESQFNRATQAERQPGSAFKPFVYLAALETGLSPWDKRVDAPITLSSRIDEWSPQNFTEKFAGEITLTEAFARSINTVAVLLGEEVGREVVISAASRFGLKDMTPIRSLSLGAHVTGTGKRARIARRDIGGKTGTTNDFRDAWFVGYTQDIVTGVWVGNDENKPMVRVTGGSIPTQIFYDYMRPQLEDAPVSKLLIASEPAWVKQDRVLENLLKTIEDTLP